MRMFVTRVVLGVLLMGTPVYAGEVGEWKRLEEAHGVVVEGRAVSGSQLREVRVVAQCVASPQKLFEVLWDVRAQAQWVPNLKELRVLRSSDDEHLIYERVKIPVVQDRDYVLRMTKKIDAASGVYEIIGSGASELGPAPTSGVVRMTELRSRFTLAPSEGGGSRITYVSFGDPAGKIPMWIARAADVRGPKDFVVALIKRATR